MATGNPYYPTKIQPTTPQNMDSLVNGAGSANAKQKIAIALAEQSKKKGLL